MGSPVVLTDPTGLKINWGKVFSVAVIAVTTAVTVAGVIASAGGLAVAVGAALSVSSATATTLASAAVAVVAAANVAVGLSDITEVVTEKTNPIRDYVFNGDQEAYDRAKIALSLTTAGMVEVAANAPDVKKKSAPTIEDDDDDLPTTGKSRNPDGRKGGEAHQGKISEISGEYKEKGYKVETESRVKTHGGYKENRYADVKVTDPQTGESDYFQVGVTNKTGQPNTYAGAVSRERKAIDDMVNYGGVDPDRIHYVTYKQR